MSWTLDNAHSNVGFSVGHMMISTVRGEFQTFDADIDIDPDNLSDSKIEATVEVGSIDTSNEDRDDHLKSGDFFDVEAYPEITFESRDISTNGGDEIEVTGDLTIKGVTNSITLTGQQQGPAKDPWGNEVVGYTLSGDINREDFGLTWNQTLETGGVLVGKEVSIDIDAEVSREA